MRVSEYVLSKSSTDDKTSEVLYLPRQSTGEKVEGFVRSAAGSLAECFQ